MNVLHHGDCLEIMPTLSAGSIDLILCDLPYGTTQCSWDSIIPFDELWKQYCILIKESGAIVLFSAQPFTSLLIASNLDMFRYEWIWEKGAATGFLNAKLQPLRAHENICVFYSKKPTFNPQMTHGHERKTSKKKSVNSECYGKALKLQEYDSTSRYPRDVQFFSSDKQIGSFHPTQKPVSIMEYLIKTYSNKGDVVMDNCMGSGTTGVACVNTKRDFIGIEKEQKYFETASSRINEAADKLKYDLFGGVA